MTEHQEFDRRAGSNGSAAAPATDDLQFRPGDSAHLGVELELPLLDRETGELVPGSPRVLGACADEGLDGVSAELMQSMIEVRTDVCGAVQEVREQLAARTRRVRNVARSLGYDLAMWGTHPWARPTTQAVFPAERYKDAEDRLAWMAYHRVTFGLHVHVGVGGGDQAIGLINLLVQYLPHLLAVSANSPFWHGIDTGLASARAALYGLVAHAGIPGYFESWKDFRSYLLTMRGCGLLRTHRDLKWDIRPRPDLGTIEFRICDMPDSLRAVMAIAAMTRSLVVHGQRLLEERPQLCRGDIRRQWLATENKWLATRFGLEAVYIRTASGKRRLLRQELGDLVERLLPIAAEFGDDRYIKALLPIERLENGATRQRRLYRQHGEWKPMSSAAVAALAAELGGASAKPAEAGQ